MNVFLFDIDGTLVLSGGAGKAAMEDALCQTFGIALAAEQVSYSGRTDRGIARDLFRIHGVHDSNENYLLFIARYLKLLPGYLKKHVGEVLPGVRDLLESLGQRRDTALGLLTGNLRDGARIKLEHFDLHPHFQFGGFGDEHADRDEVARQSLKAVSAYLGDGVVPEQVVVIGDTPLDVRCARAIGARAVAVATGWHPRHELEAAQADLVLDDLTGHDRWLEKCLLLA